MDQWLSGWNFIRAFAVTNHKEIAKMKNIQLASVMLVIVLSACGPSAKPTLEQSISTATLSLSTNTLLAVIPTLTSTVSPTPLQFPLSSTETRYQNSQRVVHYYFVDAAKEMPPKGSVWIMPETYILAPTSSDIMVAPDTVINLKFALQEALNDGRNGWTSSNLNLVEVSFSNGFANVVIQGEYFGVGDVTLIAAKMQILLTIFADETVQSATVTLNGDTIGNLGVSHSMNAKPVDYVFTRSEIETYITEHTYVSP